MVGKLCDLVLIDAPHLVPPEAHGLSASEVTEEQRGWWFSQPHGYFKVCTLMTRKNMHARSFFFKDLATPIGFIRAYMLIEFSKLQNIYIKKH